MIVTFADGSQGAYENEIFRSGGEGDTYRSLDHGSLVKFYYDQAQPRRIRQRLHDLITLYNPTEGARAWGEYFAWPDAIALTADGAPRIGMRMRFVTGLRAMESFVFGKAYSKLPPEERGWFIGRLAVAIRLASAAHRLANMGLCYPDFSDRNVLVDAFTGQMVLIDCDSLAVPNKIEASVEGSDWYRAPEIVTRQVTAPSVLTDRHNLAVLLYLWLLNWHPLMGDKVFSSDPVRDDELRFGEQALYIEHPTDHSNQAKGDHPDSLALGPELQDLFRRSFVAGLHDPASRPQPIQWVSALNNAFDRLVPCVNPDCDWRSYVATPGTLVRCPRCHVPLRQPATLPFLTLRRHGGSSDPDDYAPPTVRDVVLVGWHGRTIMPWRADATASSLPTDNDHAATHEPVARFLYTAPEGHWLIVNLRLPHARTRTSGAAWQDWPEGSALILLPEQEIQFGDAPNALRASVTLHSLE